jgi:hypothetical protein
MTRFGWWMLWGTQLVYGLMAICVRDLTQTADHPFKLAVGIWVLMSLFAIAFEVDQLFGKDYLDIYDTRVYRLVRKSKREKKNG